MILIASSNSFAGQFDIFDSQNIQYSGYVGYSQLFGTVETEKTLHDSYPQAGLNLTYNNGNFQIFNQFRYGTNIDTILVYNFAQYTFNLYDETTLAIRGGKVRHEHGLYNTSRINPKTRQGIIMPQSIYWDAFNELMTSGTGVEGLLTYKDVQLTFTIDDPTVVDNKDSTRVFYGPFLNSLKTTFGSHMNAAFTYSPKTLPLTIKSTWSRFNMGNDTSLLVSRVYPHLYKKDAISEILTIGAEYKWDKFIFSAEMMAFRALENNWTEFDKLNKGYSFTGVYQIDENLDLRLNYNQYASANIEHQNPKTPWVGYYKDFNIGFNYHTGPWQFQIEGHHINGSRTLNPSDVTDPYPYKNWYLLATQISYSF